VTISNQTDMNFCAKQTDAGVWSYNPTTLECTSIQVQLSLLGVSFNLFILDVILKVKA